MAHPEEAPKEAGEGADRRAVGGRYHAGDQPERRPNRLAGETSPYLLQHAFNPVDWHPWGPEALSKAGREDKPILLSIGYAACHWCHVMEHESFEDEATAGLMNRHFVPIKVDREERPDLDAIYMDAVQSMTGHGGWPMTVFLTPSGEPFYAGTYFPKEDRHGLPAFTKVLDAIAEAWRQRRPEIEEQGRRIVLSLGQAGGLRGSAEPLTDQVLLQAHAGLRRAFDPRWGGFGGAPKFPQPMTLEFLLRCGLRGYEASLEMVQHTLDRMAAGGIYDQVGGGFHRYSVDGRWHVPHFEKMLYDNAQLARLYVRAWQLESRDRHRQVAEQTLDYLMREMRHPAGGFFSSQDADSEGEEGRFFVWSHDDVVSTAGGAGNGGIGAAVATYLGAVPEGNWEGGKNVLWTPVDLDRVADEAGLPPAQLQAHVDAARRSLFAVRERRVKPATDDKVLAAWNGLAISAFAEAGRVLDRPDYVEAAVAAADFILGELRSKEGRLLRSWRDGRTGGPGFLDDHALMAEACLALYETTFAVKYFREARRLADDMLTLFSDPEGGGFFQAGSDAEELVIRPKEVFDNAVPAGNSAVALVLQRLALFTGEVEYERAAVSALRLVRDLMTRAPTGFGQALSALDFYLGGPKEIAIVGDPDDVETRALVDVVHGRFFPNAVLAVGRPGDPAMAEVPLLQDRSEVGGRAAAYVCERFVCQRPVTDAADLSMQLLS